MKATSSLASYQSQATARSVTPPAPFDPIDATLLQAGLQGGLQAGKAAPLRRLLVIDDQLETAESLMFALRCEGYDARFECSSIEGIASTNSWLPDVVILDADMPERDGFETAAIIRRIVPNPDLVIIAFTGLDLPAGPQTAYRAGFDGYCQKGQPLRVLLDTIDTVCASALP